jgi:hypothetical protein
MTAFSLCHSTPFFERSAKVRAFLFLPNFSSLIFQKSQIILE